jgi:tripartite ATP-independent transporter DctM subunit
MGPGLSKEILEKEAIPKRNIFDFIRTMVLPIFLVLAVLGSIYSGIATPTEAAAVGAFGALIVAAINRRLNRQAWKEANMEALRLTAMILWIALGGFWFSSVYQAIGASSFVSEMMLGSDMGPWGILILMQLTFFFLGCLMDAAGIIFITMPIYFPIINHIGFDPVWFGVLFIINMEMAYLTPPFGVNLFYLRAIAPKDVTMGNIYRSCLPFVGIQGLALLLCMVFPQIITWLPSQMMK